jgi:hypothetical protein
LEEKLMSEAMVVETIIEAYWLLQGYWTKSRYAFQTKSSGWSDIDVLAYHPEQKILVISESKARGQKKDVFVYPKEPGYGIFQFDKEMGNYFSFLSHIREVCFGDCIFKNFRDMVRTVVGQLVSNYYIKDRDLPEVKKDIFKRVKRDVPKSVEVQIRLDTTFKIFCEIIKRVNADRRGRRYGHPVLDIAREINRYVNPKLSYAGEEKNRILKDLRAMFDQSLEG